MVSPLSVRGHVVQGEGSSGQRDGEPQKGGLDDTQDHGVCPQGHAASGTRGGALPASSGPRGGGQSWVPLGSHARRRSVCFRGLLPAVFTGSPSVCLCPDVRLLGEQPSDWIKAPPYSGVASLGLTQLLLQRCYFLPIKSSHRYGGEDFNLAVFWGVESQCQPQQDIHVSSSSPGEHCGTAGHPGPDGSQLKAEL